MFAGASRRTIPGGEPSPTSALPPRQRENRRVSATSSPVGSVRPPSGGGKPVNGRRVQKLRGRQDRRLRGGQGIAKPRETPRSRWPSCWYEIESAPKPLSHRFAYADLAASLADGPSSPAFLRLRRLQRAFTLASTFLMEPRVTSISLSSAPRWERSSFTRRSSARMRA